MYKMRNQLGMNQNGANYSVLSGYYSMDYDVHKVIP